MKQSKTTLDLSKADGFKVARKIIEAARKGLSPFYRHISEDRGGYCISTSSNVEGNSERTKNLALVQLDLMESELDRDEKEFYDEMVNAEKAKQQAREKRRKV